ncbi:UDP-glycosyltransferase [Actinidia chinensis var. chinensis]|uniref:UDP-glycosyltransferase n=1 Tax=Actinidia chinensis var. chinensis TaxID=1590841 RepID=A0A2R6PB60_ACTCC|nr:UDP-glycosyltransferase [Actinidia chinensis var. chinensis]
MMLLVEVENWSEQLTVRIALSHRTGGYMYGFVPDRFQDRGSGRAIVLKVWTLQVMILNHRTMGGFLSHCEWNLVLEGVTAGGANTVPNLVELARAIALAMSGDVPQRLRVEELGGKAMEAIRAGGSSSKDLDGLVRALAQLQVKQWE